MRSELLFQMVKVAMLFSSSPRTKPLGYFCSMFPSYQFCYRAAFSETDECVNWPFAGTYGQGYPAVDRRNPKFRPQRLVCDLAFGPLDKPYLVQRICTNAKCLNPRHLKRCVIRVKPGVRRKLTERQVKRARSEFAAKRASMRCLAKRYGVDHEAIAKAIYGETWAHVPGALPRTKRKPPPPKSQRPRDWTVRDPATGRYQSAPTFPAAEPA